MCVYRYFKRFFWFVFSVNSLVWCYCFLGLIKDKGYFWGLFFCAKVAFLGSGITGLFGLRAKKKVNLRLIASLEFYII